jgi:HAE1 family hydrophobic/amphiphilic exporter-1
MPEAQVFPQPSLDLSNPEVWVTPKWVQAADMQLTAADLGYAVDALVDGAYATDYYTGGDKIDLRIVGETQFAKNSQSVAAMPIATPTGQLVPLEAVADIQIASGPEQINHRTRQRAITLQVTPPVTMPLEAAMDLISDQVIDPLQASGQLQGGYGITLAGTADKLRSTWNSLWMNLVLAVLITYLLMAATFESWLYPFVVIVTVPIGAVGGFAGLWLLNWWVLQPLDVLTMLGFIMLVGTVVNNPILIVEQSLVHIREDGMPVGEAVVESVRTRIRPIFMTTLGGLVGLLPLVLAPGAGSELYRGIGAVLLGGLLVSTVVTLVFVPALLSLMMQAGQGLSHVVAPQRPPEAARPELVHDLVPAENRLHSST